MIVSDMSNINNSKNIKIIKTLSTFFEYMLIAVAAGEIKVTD